MTFQASFTDSEGMISRYKEVLEDLEEVIWECELPDFKMTFVNAHGFEKLCGYPVQDFFKSSSLWHGLIDAKDRSRLDIALQEVADGTRPRAEVYYRFLLPNGKHKWFRDHFKRAFDKESGTWMLRGILSDVTDIKKGEIQSEIINSSMEDLVLEFDQNFKLVSQYRPEVQDLDLDFTPLLGKRIRQFGLTSFSSFLEQALRMVKDNRGAQEFEFQDSLGRGRWFRSRVSMVHSRVDFETRFAVRIIDITEDWQTRQRLDLTLKALKIGAWHWDIKGNMFNFAGALRVMYGLDLEEFIDASASLERLVDGPDLIPMMTELKRCQKTHSDFDFKFQLRLPDGPLRKVQAKGSIQTDESGIAVSMQGILWDITPENSTE